MKRLHVSPLVLRAIEIAEKRLGMQELSTRLEATPAAIQAWRFGHAEMPDKDFLRLVDLLTELEPGWLSRRTS